MPTGPARLALEVEEAELVLERDRRIADLGAGMVPEGAWRARTPAEVRAGTNFARLAAGIDAAGDNLGARLVAARAELVALILADVAALPSRVAVAARLLDLAEAGVADVEGATDLLEQTRRDALDALAATYEAAGAAVVEEASRQGADLTDSGFGPDAAERPPSSLAGPGLVDELDRAQLIQLARRLSNDVAGATVITRNAAVGAANDGPVRELIADVARAADALSPRSLEEYARNAAASATGLGRVAAVRQAAAEPREVYASEILDRNVCGPCSFIDGTTYATLADARHDYPAGQFRACAGGERCRGTLIFVWQAEAPATLQTPGDRPPPPPTVLRPRGGPRPPTPAPAPSPPLPLPKPPPVPAAAAVPLDADAAVTAAQLKAARRQLAGVRKQIRDRAVAVQAEAAEWLDQADAAKMKMPARLELRKDPLTGALHRVSAPEYEWFFNLSAEEQHRIRLRWFDKDATSTPDEIADRLMDVHKVAGFDEAMAAWLDATRRYEAGGAMARGRLPSERIGRVDVDALFGTGEYRVAEIFADEAEALASLARTDAALAEEMAARMFRPPRSGRPAGYELTEAEFVAEVEELNARLATVGPISADEFGADYSPADRALLDRADELIPPDLDLAEFTTYQAVYERLRRLAEQAGLLPEAQP